MNQALLMEQLLLEMQAGPLINLVHSLINMLRPSRFILTVF